MDLSKLNLNVPAFGEGSQNIEELETPSKDSDQEPKKEVKEEKPAEEPQTPEGNEESEDNKDNKVSYSRFKKFHELYKQSEREKARLQEEYEDRIAELESQSRSQRTISNPTEMPDWWKKLFGDTNDSKEMYGIWQQNNPQINEEDILTKVEQRILERQQQEESRIQENIGILDEVLDDISVLAGRDLTDSEQDKLLDLIDDYSPKDNRGNYLGLISPEKLWAIYEMDNKVSTASKKSSRDKVAGLTGLQSQGEPTSEQMEKDKNFNPSWSVMDALKRGLNR